MALVYTVFKFFNLIARLFFRLEVSGKENLAAMKRPYIVCPNHQSYLDPFLVTSEYAFDNFKNSFAVGASQFFESKFMQSLAAILNTFPEGARAFDGELHEFKKGAAILAVELDVPIVPVALDGFYKVWGRSSGKINLSKTQIRYGKPFLPREVITEDMTDEAQYAAVTAHLKSEIERMLGEMRSNQ
jgi:1-acyl-sn-glycerol-3-phosphate acyltransferase